MRSLRLAILALLLVGAEQIQPLAACGPGMPQPAFWYRRQPDLPERFLAGDLGVLTADLDDVYLYLAFRHLTGPGLDEESRVAAAELFEPPTAGAWSFDAAREWSDAVRRVTKRLPAVSAYPAHREITRPDGAYGGHFVNCLEDAFLTAAATLRQRADHYGPEAPQVAAWIAAQEVVFSNCAGPFVAPEPLAESDDRLARADRTYQIAAAHFYGLDYEGAGARFRAIATDRASPWSDLSAYLQARALIRDWSVGSAPQEERLEQARAVLDSILTDESRSAVHGMAGGLKSFVLLRLDPEGSLNRLRQQLTAARLRRPLRQDLIDYRWLLRRLPADHAAVAPALDRWLLALHHRRVPQSPPGTAHPELWLAAELMLTAGAHPGLAALLGRAAEVPPESRLYATARYHRARLQARARDYEAARQGLDAMPPEVFARLGPGDRNRFALLRARVAPTLADRIERGQRIPVGYTSYHLSGEEPLETAYDESLHSFAGRTLPADVAVDALNLASTERLVRWLTTRGALAPDLLDRLAPLVWTRAALLGEEELALALAPVVAEALPAFASELADYRRAAAGEERLFSAALSILRFPGLRPTLRHGFGRSGLAREGGRRMADEEARFSYLRDNWWCSAPLHLSTSRYDLGGIRLEDLAPLSAADRAEAEGSLAALRDMEAAPTHLGHVVLAWAETHRADSRVPEALHRVVRATRVCGRGDISRVAFQTLHGRYPQSPWAAKTRHWYD